MNNAQKKFAELQAEFYNMSEQEREQDIERNTTEFYNKYKTVATADTSERQYNAIAAMREEALKRENEQALTITDLRAGLLEA